MSTQKQTQVQAQTQTQTTAKAKAKAGAQQGATGRSENSSSCDESGIGRNP